MVHTHTATKMIFGVVLLSSILLVVGFFAATTSAQTAEEQVAERRAQLERELAQIEKEIAAQQTLLEGKQRERVSLERDVAILDAGIQKAQLSIRARELEIRRLSQDITGKEQTIGSLNSKLSREKQSLAQLIRRTNEIDDYSLAEIILGNNNFSDFFEDLDNFDAIKAGLNKSFEHIAVTKDDTQTQKGILENRKSAEEELRHIQVLERQKIEVQEREKKRILTATKGQEAAYQSLINVKQKSAAQIRAELFTLRGSAAIPFAEALQYAQEASKKTGVRPAFILGIIAEESNLGENVGNGTWSVDMHPTRDRPIFAEITARLGLDPNTMPVSKKPWYGWGGAMGPAQFIPSTWVLYEDRIAKSSGQNPPNPWDPRTAFIASGLLLMDNGADRGTTAAERLAALRYFAGWVNATKPSYAFYGDEVMGLAEKYQGMIDILNAS